MALEHLSIQGLRNLEPCSLSFSPSINIISGPNGSGKTSLLEAIHLLGMGRSFRSSRLQTLVRHTQTGYLIFGRTRYQDSSHALGLERSQDGASRIRIDGRDVTASSELAAQLPLQLIHPESFDLLSGSPGHRRQFMDWGVFHVERGFLPVWQRFQYALRQRNAFLRHATMPDDSGEAWERELATCSDSIDAYRQAFLKGFRPIFEEVLDELISIPDFQFSYFRGWDRERSLTEVLLASRSRDLKVGHTHSGPQRADLRLRIGKLNAADVLSRGQQKLVVCAMRIAQGYYLNQFQRGRCIYLLDDLPAELDFQHRKALCRLLESLDCQVFVTCIENSFLEGCWQADAPVSLFHVEQGVIREHRATVPLEAKA